MKTVFFTSLCISSFFFFGCSFNDDTATTTTNGGGGSEELGGSGDVGGAEETGGASSVGGAEETGGTGPVVSVIDFEEVQLPASPTKLQRLLLEELPSGVDPDSTSGTSLPFLVQGGSFETFYTPKFDSWNGFALSADGDTTTAGFGNQFSSITGAGADGSKNFLVTYFASWSSNTPTITFPQATNGVQLLSLQATNGTYLYLTMKEGDSFSDAFGGTDGTQPDYCRAFFTGKLAGVDTGEATLFLGDYLSSEPERDYLLQSWLKVDLSSLGVVDTLTVEVECSCNSANCGYPTYVLLDNLSYIAQ